MTTVFQGRGRRRRRRRRELWCVAAAATATAAAAAAAGAGADLLPRAQGKHLLGCPSLISPLPFIFILLLSP
jgi:hypothetical protein